MIPFSATRLDVTSKYSPKGEGGALVRHVERFMLPHCRPSIRSLFAFFLGAPWIASALFHRSQDGAARSTNLAASVSVTRTNRGSSANLFPRYGVCICTRGNCVYEPRTCAPPSLIRDGINPDREIASRQFLSGSIEPRGVLSFLNCMVHSELTFVRTKHANQIGLNEAFNQPGNEDLFVRPFNPSDF